MIQKPKSEQKVANAIITAENIFTYCEQKALLVYSLSYWLPMRICIAQSMTRVFLSVAAVCADKQTLALSNLLRALQPAMLFDC